MNTSNFATGSGDYSQMREALNRMQSDHKSDWQDGASSNSTLSNMETAWGKVADSLINQLIQSENIKGNEMSLIEKAIDALTIQIEAQNSDEDLSSIRSQCEEIIRLASPVLHISLSSTEEKLKHLALACNKQHPVEKQKKKVHFPEEPVTKLQSYEIDEGNKFSKKSVNEKTKATIAAIEMPDNVFQEEQRSIKAQVLGELALMVNQLKATNDALVADTIAKEDLSDTQADLLQYNIQKRLILLNDTIKNALFHVYEKKRADSTERGKGEPLFEVDTRMMMEFFSDIDALAFEMQENKALSDTQLQSFLDRLSSLQDKLLSD